MLEENTWCPAPGNSTPPTQAPPSPRETNHSPPRAAPTFRWVVPQKASHPLTPALGRAGAQRHPPVVPRLPVQGSYWQQGVGGGVAGGGAVGRIGGRPPLQARRGGAGGVGGGGARAGRQLWGSLWGHPDGRIMCSCEKCPGAPAPCMRVGRQTGPPWPHQTTKLHRTAANSARHLVPVPWGPAAPLPRRPQSPPRRPPPAAAPERIQRTQTRALQGRWGSSLRSTSCQRGPG